MARAQLSVAPRSQSLPGSRGWDRRLPWRRWLSGHRGPRGPGFTLIELILVMAMLSIVLALAAPALARFFRGRGLDAEARRFVALVRYAQSRAVFEGLPMRLWLDPAERTYGLEAEPGYLEPEQDDKAVVFSLSDHVLIEVEQPPVPTTLTQLTQFSQGPQWTGTWQVTDRRPMLRFSPDGFICETSPEFIVFRLVRDGEEQDAVWIGRTRNRLSYEVQTVPAYWARR